MSQKNVISENVINLPWHDPNTKTGFSWAKYLEATRSKIAPSKIFDETSRFPHSTNRFKVGMKLEAIDPEHPALFCVVTVVSIKGSVLNKFELLLYILIMISSSHTCKVVLDFDVIIF